jgi:hypothetical protein
MVKLPGHTSHAGDCSGPFYHAYEAHLTIVHRRHECLLRLLLLAAKFQSHEYSRIARDLTPSPQASIPAATQYLLKTHKD